MDTTDRKLLNLLQQDGKVSYAALGAEVGLSVSSINERVKKLQKLGYIKQYSALLNPDALGLGMTSFVQVLISEVSSAHEFESAIDKIPEVLECHFVTGEYSYLLKIICRDTKQLQRIIQDHVQAISSVIRTNTLIALSTSKSTTVLPTDGLDS